MDQEIMEGFARITSALKSIDENLDDIVISLRVLAKRDLNDPKGLI